MNNNMEAEKLNWGNGSHSFDTFKKYYTEWNLQSLIKAAENTEESVRIKLVNNSSKSDELKGKTLQELLTLPEGLEYKVNNDKDIDQMEKEVINLLLRTGYAEEAAINMLINQTDYKDLKAKIQSGDIYSTSSELLKGLQDLSLAKKLGYDKVQVTYQGDKRVDRDITLEFISEGPRGGSKTVRIMDEVKSNMGSFYIGGSSDGVDILMQLLKSKNTTYEAREDSRSQKKKFFFYIQNEELENAVNYVIYHKYGGRAKVDGTKDFRTNTVFSSPSGDVRLLSDMLKELQDDLNKGNNSTIMKFIWERLSREKAKFSLAYGFNKQGGK